MWSVTSDRKLEGKERQLKALYLTLLRRPPEKPGASMHRHLSPFIGFYKIEVSWREQGGGADLL